MISALRNLQRLRLTLAADPIDQPMLAIDPAGPPAAQLAAQRFGLARAARGIPASTAMEGQFVPFLS